MQGVGMDDQMMMVRVQYTGFAAYKCCFQGGGAMMQAVVQQPGDLMQMVSRLCYAALQMVC